MAINTSDPANPVKAASIHSLGAAKEVLDRDHTATWPMAAAYLPARVRNRWRPDVEHPDCHVVPRPACRKRVGES